MAKAAWIALAAVVGLGNASLCFADEEAAPEVKEPAEDVVSFDDVLNSPRYLNEQLVPLALGASRDPATFPALEVDFEESTMLGRLSGVRCLSLLTLSEKKRSRLFLGVNQEGLLGLHLTGERTVEFARLPKRDD